MELPTGTVTFFFTDIEGSTRLLQSLGDQYAESLARHSEIIEAAVRTRDGTVVNTEGDAYFCVFDNAPDAAAAAVEIILDMASFDWPADNEFKVRIGMHTGEGVLGGRDYVGMDVHRAARISAAGHGGQVLLSSDSNDQTEGRLPEGVTSTDLGRVELKDLPEAEHIFQLVIPGISSKFPGLRVGANPPISLPPIVAPVKSTAPVAATTPAATGLLSTISRGRLGVLSLIGGLVAGLGIGWGVFAGGETCELCAGALDPATSSPEESPTPSTAAAAADAAVNLCEGDPIVIRDEDMADSNWTYEFITNTPVDNPWYIVDGLVGQDQTGGGSYDTGLDPPSRWIWYAWDASTPPGNVTIRHSYTGGEIPGGVDSLRLSFDTWGGSVLVTPVVIQGDTAFAVQGLVTGGADSHAFDSTCLTSSDFTNGATTGPANPDFSQPMLFGYATASTSQYSENRDLRVNVMDNFTVEYWPSD